MTRRTLRLTAVAAVAALGLTLAGCQNYQGTAAYVGDSRITTRDVEKQVDEFYAMPFWAKQAKDARAAVNNAAIRLLIIDQLSEQLVRDRKVTVPEATLQEIEASFKKQPEQIPSLVQGVSPELSAEVYMRLSVLAGKPAHSLDEPAARALLEGLEDVARRHPVKVNPRYGAFKVDAKSLQLGVLPRKDAGVQELEESPQPVEEPQPDQQPN